MKNVILIAAMMMSATALACNDPVAGGKATDKAPGWQFNVANLLNTNASAKSTPKQVASVSTSSGATR